MLKFILLLSLFTLSTFAVFAQASDVCDVQLKVYAVETIRQENPVQLENVKIVVKNSAGKIVNPSKGATNLYEKLPDGDYELVAALAGYKTSVKKFKPACPEESIPPVAASMYVFMWKGDPKEKMETDSILRGTVAVARVPEGSTGVKLTQNSQAPILNGNATNLVRPAYPSAARAVRASGAVNVQVTIDELGYVVSAKAVSGHPMLQSAAVKAARESKFTPTTLEEIPVRVVGIIVYNFSSQ